MNASRLLFLCAALLAGASLPARAAAPQALSLDERLQRLETEVGRLRDENSQLRTALGLGPGAAPAPDVTPAGHEAALSVGGMLQGQADFGDRGDARFTTGNDRFYLRRARINVQGRFLEHFAFRVEGEFAGSLGEGTGSRAQLTDGYIEWNRFALAQVRIGQFKTPFGFEQLSADPRLFTIERSMGNDRLAAGRQIGVQVAGDLLDRRVSYAAGLFNGTGVNTNANDNDRFMSVGRLSAVAWQGALAGRDARWSVGADALATTDATLTGQPSEFGFDLVPGGARDNTFAGRRRAGGLDTQLHLGPFDFWAEGLRERFEPADALPARRLDAEGWYVQAAWFALPKTLQAVLKYDVYDPNLDAASDRTRTWTAGANYFIKGDDLKLQLDYLLTAIDGPTPENRKLLLRLQTLF